MVFFLKMAMRKVLGSKAAPAQGAGTPAQA